MTNGERLDALHSKMKERKRKLERRKTLAAGTGCAVSAAGLSFFIADGVAHPAGTAGIYSGAAMLFGGSGGYVLVAVVSFTAGAFLAAMLVRKRAKAERARPEEEKEEKSKKE